MVLDTVAAARARRAASTSTYSSKDLSTFELTPGQYSNSGDILSLLNSRSQGMGYGESGSAGFDMADFPALGQQASQGQGQATPDSDRSGDPERHRIDYKLQSKEDFPALGEPTRPESDDTKSAPPHRVVHEALQVRRRILFF